MSSNVHGLLHDVIAPLVAAEGLDLEDLEVTLVGRRRRIAVVVDADGGVDLDRCAEVSRLISAALDAGDVTGDGAYTLEVGSPGVSRPLTLPRHWRRNAGRLVRVTLLDGGELTGRITGSDDEAAVLDVDGGERAVPYPAVAKAQVQVEFRRAAESGSANMPADGRA